MHIHLHTHSIEQIPADVAAVALAFEGETAADSPMAQRFDAWTQGLTREMVESGELTGKLHDVVLVHRPGGLQAKRLLLVGAGKRQSFTPAELRKVAGFVHRTVRLKGIRQTCLLLEDSYSGPEYVAAAVEGALLGDYETDVYKTDPKKNEKRVDGFSVVVPQGQEAELQPALERGRILGEAQNVARVLANEPPNKLTPEVLARNAREMAESYGLECEILDVDRMRELGFGAHLGVSQGSIHPPTVTILRYQPEGGGNGVHLGLVGKGVTFDTGGISIKPADGMEKMKYDMAGAASVVGAMQAIAQRKPKVAVTAIIPASENMPDGASQRPGDIVTSLSGKTIEILNTDAEGRLLLADAITYIKRLGVTHIVDTATLTGAIVVALGTVYVGAFTNNDEFLGKVLTASKAEGEKMWHMPTDDEYREQLKSPYADIPNIGTRGAGSITAAKFVEEFVDGTPWVHLDIAGTAWLDDGKPYLAKGPTGVGVRTFVRLAESL